MISSGMASECSRPTSARSRLRVCSSWLLTRVSAARNWSNTALAEFCCATLGSAELFGFAAIGSA